MSDIPEAADTLLSRSEQMDPVASTWNTKSMVLFPIESVEYTR